MFRDTSLPTNLLLSTVRILGRNKAGSTWTGTGFYFAFNFPAAHTALFLVTNRHVLEDCRYIELPVRAEPDDPEGSKVHVLGYGDPQPLCVYHPDQGIDLAAFAVHPILNACGKLGKRCSIKYLSEEFIPSEDLLRSLPALEKVVMCGCPIGLWDDYNSLPLLRTGHTASHPQIDFGGKPIGVVDMSCLPGSSGSPIALFSQGSYIADNQLVIGGVREVLLGVLFGGPQVSVAGEIVVQEIPHQPSVEYVSRIPAHLGYYVKARELLTLKKEILCKHPRLAVYK